MTGNDPLDWDHNPFLKPWENAQPTDLAGKGTIETAGEVRNIVWQTRAAPPGDYENALGDALVACFDDGVTELDALVDRLNAMGVRAPGGAPWTPESFQAEMARLGG